MRTHVLYSDDELEVIGSGWRPDAPKRMHRTAHVEMLGRPAASLSML